MPLISRLLTLVFAVTATLTASAETPAPSRNVFWSGHSLTGPPIPQMLTGISQGFGVTMQWNQHSMAGASMEARTRGRPPNYDGWDGYRQGDNRDTVGMDVIEEFRTGATIDGQRYDTLVITEVHDFLYWLLRGDTVRLLRHYHERFLEGNPAGSTWFYHAWLNIYDKSDPQAWIDFERAAEPIWQCIATRVNTSLEAENRGNRLGFIPAGRALTNLAERAVSAGGVPGITADTVPGTMDNIFYDTVHLTDDASYFVALVVYAFVEQRSPAGAWAPAGMSDAEAKALQEIAWDFRNDYVTSNVPLSLPECSAVIRDSFAQQFWEFLDARARYRDQPWHETAWQYLTGPAKARRNTREWQQAFADDGPDNPFRYDPATDAAYWYPAP